MQSRWNAGQGLHHVHVAHLSLRNQPPLLPFMVQPSPINTLTPSWPPVHHSLLLYHTSQKHLEAGLCPVATWAWLSPFSKKKNSRHLVSTSSLVLSKSAFHTYQCAFYNISLTTCGKVLLRDGPQHPAPESSTRSHCPSPLGEGSLKNRQNSRLIAYSVTPCSLAANVASSPGHSRLIFANVLPVAAESTILRRTPKSLSESRTSFLEKAVTICDVPHSLRGRGHSVSHAAATALTKGNADRHLDPHVGPLAHFLKFCKDIIQMPQN